MLITMEFKPINFDWNFVFTIINLLIFYALIKKFLWNKILTTIDKRKEMINKNIKDAQDATNEAEQLKQQYQQQISAAKEESARIIDQAKGEAKVEYGKIIDSAKADAVKIKNDAQQDIAYQMQNAKRAAKEDIANLAVQMAQKVVGDTITPKANSDMYDEFLREEGSEVDG